MCRVCKWSWPALDSEQAPFSPTLKRRLNLRIASNAAILLGVSPTNTYFT
jgi:hypothetical protein